MPINQSLRKNSHVLWSISIIQDQNPQAQTKQEFSEMAYEVLNTHTIDTLTLCLADNLQRFRFMIEKGISEEEAILECQILSEKWKIDNHSQIEKLRTEKKLNFLTWQEFLDWPDYKKTMDEVENFYKENKDFRHEVDGRLRQARESFSLNCKISNPIEQTTLLKKYIFEECTFQKFASSKAFDYELYKTPMSKAMRRIKRNTDFVSSGTLTEIYFTQFYSTPKKTNLTENVDYSDNSFNPLFKQQNKSSSNGVSYKNSSVNNSPSEARKMSEFIEKTFQLLPEEKHMIARELLLKFTTENIIPLCYVNNILDPGT